MSWPAPTAASHRKRSTAPRSITLWCGRSSRRCARAPTSPARCCGSRTGKSRPRATGPGLKAPSAAGLVVAIDPLAPLVTLLGFNRECGNRPGLQALERDRLSGLLAIAVGAVFNSVQCSINFGNQLALAVAGPQLDGAVGFRGGAVGQVRMVLVLILKVLERLLGLFQDVFPPRQELAAEVVPLPLIHERLFVGRPIILVLFRAVGTVGPTMAVGTVGTVGIVYAVSVLLFHCDPTHTTRASLLAGRAYSEGAGRRQA